MYEIKYHHFVAKKDIQTLDKIAKERIRVAIEEKLTTRPEVFGKPLRKSLKGYRKLRVGDYRVIFKIEKQIIKILIIRHRTEIYKEVLKRLA